MTATATATAPTVDIDLFADEVLSDSFPTYAELRELGPVVHLPKRDIWAITRYDDIREALADPAPSRRRPWRSNCWSAPETAIRATTTIPRPRDA